MTQDAFCSFCGTAFAPPLRYPRTCTSCKTQIWDNPIPVSVVLVPVRHQGKIGLLVVRRGIPPVGKLAIVGGFLEAHETWQQGGAREVLEETGVTLIGAPEPFWFTSTEPKPNRVLLFSLAPTLDSLGAFTPNAETLERGLVFGPDGLEGEFAFPLHVQAAKRFFAHLKISGPHAYTPV
jgi:ADP-ribose pyrophosphatase YjhB (NUDIX family)